ncbi:MAG: allantoinase AllB [Myxococcales bacterium]|nr:allantoinase AllB [Myxococcales bacterium]
MKALGNKWLLRGQRIVFPDAVRPAMLQIEGERITDILPIDHENPSGLVVLDAGNLAVLPGLVDTHAHINEPGRTDWEGFVTATRACAAGGITTVVDMPLNSIPATTTLSALQIKRQSARGQCQIDYGFWGGVVPGNRDELSAMVDAGALGFKAFMCESGVDEFPASSLTDLEQAMHVLREKGVPLLVHAELEGPAPRVEDGDVRSYESYLRSRPREFENRAIAALLPLLRRTACRTHVVHLSSSDALSLLAQARDEGLPLSAETCPHYLSLCAEDVPSGATWFKCAPPIRERMNNERLWLALKSGDIDFVVSDHSPCTPGLKHMERGDFARAWGGISSIQFSLPVVWSGLRTRGMSISDLVRLMCQNTARFAGLAHRKGSIAVGKDADLVLFDDTREYVLSAETIQHRHKVTPYLGRALCGRVQVTILRGRVIYEEGNFPTPPTGREVGTKLSQGMQSE